MTTMKTFVDKRMVAITFLSERFRGALFHKRFEIRRFVQ